MGTGVLKVKEVAQALGISESTLRRWEKYLDLEIPRDQDGDRFYDQDWLAYFKQVKVLVDQDRDFEEIKKTLTPPQASPPAPPTPPTLPPDQDALEALQKQMLSLSEEIVALGQADKAMELRMKALTEKNTDLISEVTSLSQTVEGLSEEVNTLNTRNTELVKALSALQDEVKALKSAPSNPNTGNFWKFAVIVFFVLVALGLISRGIMP